MRCQEGPVALHGACQEAVPCSLVPAEASEDHFSVAYQILKPPSAANPFSSPLTHRSQPRPYPCSTWYLRRLSNAPRTPQCNADIPDLSLSNWPATVVQLSD